MALALGHAPADIFAVYDELKKDAPKRHFTVGIDDDVTHLSLPLQVAPDIAPKGTISAKFWGISGDGTVDANKNSVKIVGDHTDKFVQALFQHDSKNRRRHHITSAFRRSTHQ